MARQLDLHPLELGSAGWADRTPKPVLHANLQRWCVIPEEFSGIVTAPTTSHSRTRKLADAHQVFLNIVGLMTDAATLVGRPELGWC